MPQKVGGGGVTYALEATELQKVDTVKVLYTNPNPSGDKDENGYSNNAITKIEQIPSQIEGGTRLRYYFMDDVDIDKIYITSRGWSHIYNNILYNVQQNLLYSKNNELMGIINNELLYHRNNNSYSYKQKYINSESADLVENFWNKIFYSNNNDVIELIQNLNEIHSQYINTNGAETLTTIDFRSYPNNDKINYISYFNINKKNRYIELELDEKENSIFDKQYLWTYYYNPNLVNENKINELKEKSQFLFKQTIFLPDNTKITLSDNTLKFSFEPIDKNTILMDKFYSEPLSKEEGIKFTKFKVRSFFIPHELTTWSYKSSNRFQDGYELDQNSAHLFNGQLNDLNLHKVYNNVKSGEIAFKKGTTFELKLQKNSPLKLAYYFDTNKSECNNNNCIDGTNTLNYLNDVHKIINPDLGMIDKEFFFPSSDVLDGDIHSFNREGGKPIKILEANEDTYKIELSEDLVSDGTTPILDLIKNIYFPYKTEDEVLKNKPVRDFLRSNKIYAELENDYSWTITTPDGKQEVVNGNTSLVKNIHTDFSFLKVINNKIKYNIKYVANNEQDFGTRNITQHGKDGFIEHEEVYGKPIEDSYIQQEPIDEIVEIGTKPTTSMIERDNQQIKQTTTYIVNEDTGELTSHITEEIVIDVKPTTSNGEEKPPVYEVPEYTKPISTNTPIDENGKLILPPIQNKEEYTQPISTNTPVDKDENLILPPIVNIPEYKVDIINEPQKYTKEKLQPKESDKQEPTETTHKSDKYQDVTQDTESDNNNVVQKQTLPKTNALYISTSYVLGLLLSLVGLKQNKKD